jgi:hypothetical protein
MNLYYTLHICAHIENSPVLLGNSNYFMHIEKKYTNLMDNQVIFFTIIRLAILKHLLYFNVVNVFYRTK